MLVTEAAPRKESRKPNNADATKPSIIRDEMEAAEATRLINRHTDAASAFALEVENKGKEKVSLCVSTRASQKKTSLYTSRKDAPSTPNLPDARQLVEKALLT